jgi:hypothetical protein
MTASAAELLGWDDIARRDLPWPNPGVTAWQILVSEFMLQQTPVARVQPSGSTGWRVGPCHRPRPPRAWPTCCGPGASRAHVGVLGSDHRLALVQPFQRRHTDAAALTAQITTLGYRSSDKTVRRVPAAVPRNPHRATAGAGRAHRPAGPRLTDPPPRSPHRRRPPPAQTDPRPQRGTDSGHANLEPILTPASISDSKNVGLAGTVCLGTNSTGHWSSRESA